MRVRPLSGAFGLLLAATLGLAGCASQTAESEGMLPTRVAGWNPPAPEERAAPPPAKPEKPVAAAKKAPVKPDLAKAPQQQQPRQELDRDEAACAGVDTCTSVLKAMVAGADRSWVQRPAPPKVLANGVRLFAYRALKPTLSCGELNAAVSEVSKAARALAGPVDGLEPAQAARVRQLSAEVADELKAERAQRCPGEQRSVG
jgi:hypothetical protein